MDIVIIGTGNVAHIIGQLLKRAGHNFLQVYGRNLDEARKLGTVLNAYSTDDLSNLNNDAEVYLIAVHDDAIAEIAAKLNLPGKVILHTAGAVSMEVLKNVSEHYGVFYPIQSLRKEMNTIPPVPMLIEGSDEHTMAIVKKLADGISSHVTVSSGEERLKMHVAAVMVNNFVNHLYTLAEDYCTQEGLDFKVLKPIMEETVMRIRENEPSAVQTGPAVRNDQPTIDKHLQLLNKYPDLKLIYETMTRNIIDRNKA